MAGMKYWLETLTWKMSGLWWTESWYDKVNGARLCMGYGYRWFAVTGYPCDAL